MRTFDPDTGAGSVLTDLGVVVEFPAQAFARSGLRLLRPGQRVTVVRDGAGRVELVTIAGFPTGDGAPPPG